LGLKESIGASQRWHAVCDTEYGKDQKIENNQRGAVDDQK